MTREQWLQEMDAQLSEQGLAILDGLLDVHQCQSFQTWLNGLADQDRLKKAGMGTLAEYTVEESIRGDYICWLNTLQPPALLRTVFAFVEDMILHFRESYFLPIKDWETHATLYPPGSRFARHSDRFKHTDHRLISVVLYVNHNWKSGDGGELVLYGDEGSVTVEPVGGRMVIFRSDIEHEVLYTACDRYSLTAWLLSQPVGLTFLEMGR